MGELAKAGTARDIAKDIIEMLLMKGILVALFFERELGKYFEITPAWHGAPGSNGARPGLRVLELRSLWLELIAPFWQVRAPP